MPYKDQEKERERNKLRPGKAPCKKCGERIRKGRIYCAKCSPVGNAVMVSKECVICEKGFVVYQSGAWQKSTCGAKECISQHRSGVWNGNWRGGITSENRRLRNSSEYKTWRLAVFNRDNFCCVECGQRGWTLNADHIKPFCLYPELRFDVSNGRTLCASCHKKTSSYLSGVLRGRKPMGGVPRRTHCQCGRPYDFREKNGSPRCRPCRAAQDKKRHQSNRGKLGIKRPGEKPEPVQQSFLDDMAAGGALAFWATSVDEVARRL